MPCSSVRLSKPMRIACTDACFNRMNAWFLLCMLKKGDTSSICSSKHCGDSSSSSSIRETQPRTRVSQFAFHTAKRHDFLMFVSNLWKTYRPKLQMGVSEISDPGWPFSSASFQATPPKNCAATSAHKSHQANETTFLLPRQRNCPVAQPSKRLHERKKILIFCSNGYDFRKISEFSCWSLNMG